MFLLIFDRRKATDENPAMKIDILSLEEAERLLKPYTRVFRDAQLEAFERYKALPEEDRLDATDQFRASYLHDKAVGIASRAFRGSKVKLIDSSGLRLFEVEGEALVRFAKLGPGLRMSRNNTRQYADFEAQLPLPGMPQVTHLVVGYILDPLETSIERVPVVCPSGSGNRWSFEIDLDPIGVVVEHPRVTDEPQAPRIVSRMEQRELPDRSNSNE